MLPCRRCSTSISAPLGGYGRLSTQGHRSRARLRVEDGEFGAGAAFVHESVARSRRIGPGQDRSHDRGRVVKVRTSDATWVMDPELPWESGLARESVLTVERRDTRVACCK